MARHVDQDGVHTDHFKKERPFFVAKHIDHIVKQGHQ